MVFSSKHPIDLIVLWFGLKGKIRFVWLSQKEHAKTLSWVDKIEIHLAFQIGLKERLDLLLINEKPQTTMCTFTQQEMEELTQPVVFEGRVYEYDSFVSWFNVNPTDPISKNPIVWSEVERL